MDVRLSENVCFILTFYWMKFLHQIFSGVAAKFFSQQVLGFTDIEKIPLALHTFQYMSRFVPYHSYSRIGK